MKKNIFLCLFLFIVVLAGCTSKSEENIVSSFSPASVASETLATAPAPTVKPTYSPETAAWSEAYADFFINENYPPYFTLIDVDFDGIPELFFHTSGYGANMWTVVMLKYTESGIERIDINNTDMEIPSQFELYKDKQTGETRWMAVMDSFRSSFSHYHYEWKWIDFNNFSDVRTEFFFKWSFEGVITDAETDEFETIFYLYKNENEFAEVEYDEIEKRQQELFSKYELIGTQMLNSYLNDFAVNGDAGKFAENLDRSLIVDFLLQFEQPNASVNGGYKTVMDWKMAYKNFLESFTPYMGFISLGLYDFNADGQPELIILDDSKGTLRGRYTIVSYQSGNVVEICQHGTTSFVKEINGQIYFYRDFDSLRASGGMYGYGFVSKLNYENGNFSITGLLRSNIDYNFEEDQNLKELSWSIVGSEEIVLKSKDFKEYIIINKWTEHDEWQNINADEYISLKTGYLGTNPDGKEITDFFINRIDFYNDSYDTLPITQIKLDAFFNEWSK